MPYYKTLFGIRLWYAKLFNRDALQKALVRACLAGRTEEAERMLDAGADPNKMGRLPGDPQNAAYPLVAAIIGGRSADSRLETVGLLLRRGADPRAHMSEALRIMVLHPNGSNVVLVRLLQEAGATVDANDSALLQKICDATLVAGTSMGRHGRK